MVKKKKPEEEIPEESPAEETAKVGLATKTETPADKEAQWVKIETELSALKEEFMAGRITLGEAIDRLIESLKTIKTAESPALGGLGEGPEMIFPGTSEEEGEPSKPNV